MTSITLQLAKSEDLGVNLRSGEGERMARAVPSEPQPTGTLKRSLWLIAGYLALMGLVTGAYF